MYDHDGSRCPDCGSPIEEVPVLNDYGDRDGWRTDYEYRCTRGHGPYALDALVWEGAIEEPWDDEAA